MPRNQSIGSTFLVLALASCGGPPPPRPATHADFRAIQLHEAGIAEGRALATDPAAPCERRCAGAAQACDEAEPICGLAGRLDDADARSRCASAESACDEARSSAGGACGGCAAEREP